MSQYLHIAYVFDVSIRSHCFHFIVGFSMSFSIYYLIFLGDCSYVLIFHELITWLNIRFVWIFIHLISSHSIPSFWSDHCVWEMPSLSCLRHNPHEFNLFEKWLYSSGMLLNLGCRRIKMHWEGSCPIFLRLLN